ncbi:MAG: nucleoside hydrolase [Verrucomicrobia bacterium 61-8]|nr:nucleoside hydrolase [Verrucomicrobiota bacterium]OJV04630.1 MAG: nucleoside hydrolase [Verrucomicrobia bacterium 61-8]
MKRKILLDTDIGTDIDDAVCLAYLLSQPDCELLGITTVCGDVEERASLADALCRAAGRPDFPIFPGRERPILREPIHGKAKQAEALTRWKHKAGFPVGKATDFLRNTIRQHPGEIDLLAIGPLTNVAVLFLLDPEIAGLLRGLTIMGGSVGCRYYGNPAEYNIYCDPHAAQVVFQAGVPALRVVPLDVTTQLTMNSGEMKERFSHPLLRMVADFSTSWFESRPELTFHDPLAAVTLFQENVCRFDRGQFDVELQSDRLTGFTHWREDARNGRHEAALRVDREAFFQAYFSVF